MFIFLLTACSKSFILNDTCPSAYSKGNTYFFCHLNPIQIEICDPPQDDCNTSDCEKNCTMTWTEDKKICEDLDTSSDSLIYKFECLGEIKSDINGVTIIPYFNQSTNFQVPFSKLQSSSFVPRTTKNGAQMVIRADCKTSSGYYVNLDLSYSDSLSLECQIPTEDSYTYLNAASSSTDNSKKITVAPGLKSKFYLLFSDVSLLEKFQPEGFSEYLLSPVSSIFTASFGTFPKHQDYAIRLVSDPDYLRIIAVDFPTFSDFNINFKCNNAVITLVDSVIKITTSSSYIFQNSFNIKTTFNFGNGADYDGPSYYEINCESASKFYQKNSIFFKYNRDFVNVILNKGDWANTQYDVVFEVSQNVKRSALYAYDIYWNSFNLYSDLHLFCYVSDFIMNDLSANNGNSLHITNAFSTSDPINIKIRIVSVQSGGFNFMQENYPVIMTIGRLLQENTNVKINFLNNMEYHITDLLYINQNSWSTLALGNNVESEKIIKENLSNTNTLSVNSGVINIINTSDLNNDTAKSQLAGQKVSVSDIETTAFNYDNYENFGNLVLEDQSVLMMTDINVYHHLNSSISFPGNSYYIMFNKFSNSPSQNILCQVNLDCNKFQFILSNDQEQKELEKEGLSKYQKTCISTSSETCVGLSKNTVSMNVIKTVNYNNNDNDEIQYWRWKDIAQVEKTSTDTNIYNIGKLIHYGSVNNNHLYNIDVLNISRFDLQIGNGDNTKKYLSLVLSSQSIPKIKNLEVKKNMELHLYKYEKEFPGLKLDSFIFYGALIYNFKPYNLIQTAKTMDLDAKLVLDFDIEKINIEERLTLSNYKLSDFTPDSAKTAGFTFSSNKFIQNYFLNGDKTSPEQSKTIFQRSNSNDFTAEIIFDPSDKFFDSVCKLKIEEEIPPTILNMNQDFFYNQFTTLDLSSSDPKKAKNLFIQNSKFSLIRVTNNNIYFGFQTSSTKLEIESQNDEDINFYGRVDISSLYNIIIPANVKNIIFHNITTKNNPNIGVNCRDGTTTKICQVNIKYIHMEIESTTRRVDLSVNVSSLTVQYNTLVNINDKRKKPENIILDYSANRQVTPEKIYDTFNRIRPNVHGFDPNRFSKSKLEGFQPVVCFDVKYSCEEILKKNFIKFSHDNKYLRNDNSYVSYFHKCFENLVYPDSENIPKPIYKWKTGEISQVQVNCIATKMDDSFLENPFVFNYEKSEKRLSSGAIAGISIGVVAFIAIVAVLLLIFVFKVIKCSFKGDNDKSVSSKGKETAEDPNFALSM